MRFMDDDWRLVDHAPVPGDRVDICLYRSGDDFYIEVGGRELMSSGEHGSEDALADIGCRGLGNKPGAVVLIGGLGMGYTLARSLGFLGGDARVLVAELVPAVVEWNRGALAALAGRPLDDPRVDVRAVDVADLLRGVQGAYDAILLDVDNGPVALTNMSNDWIYSDAGLRAARAALRDGGVLAVWSAWPSAPFNEALERAGFAFDEIELPAEEGDDEQKHQVWLAR